MPPQPQQKQSVPGWPPDAELFAIEKMSSMNTKAARQSIDDQEFSWLENMFPIGPGNLRTMYGKGANIYTASGGLTIVKHFFYNIGAIQYAIVFLSDGTAYQVDVSSHAVTTISASPGTFYNGGAFPAAQQFGSFGIVIVGTAAANCYFAWDGTLYSPGSASPSWLNGGTSTTMPTGIQGTAIEIYLSRVWIDNGNARYTSAPGNGADFATSAGGVTGSSQDAFLKVKYQQLRQTSGFLYQFSDSSINSISNVQTSGSPADTSFTDLNVDPQVGTPWPDSVVEFGEGLMLGNTSGVYVLFGGTARKVSDNMDGFFIDASLPVSGNTLPSGAVATIFGIKIYMLLIPAAVDYLGVSRPIMAIWDSKKWFVGSQELPLTFISTQEVASQLNAWGTDGTHLFQLFSASSLTLKKVIQGKLWPGQSYLFLKKAAAAYIQVDDNAGSGVTINMEIDTGQASVNVPFSTQNQIFFTNTSGNVIQFQNASDENINFTVAAIDILRENADIGGNLLGLTMTTTAQDATLISANLRYRIETAL